MDQATIIAEIQKHADLADALAEIAYDKTVAAIDVVTLTQDPQKALMWFGKIKDAQAKTLRQVSALQTEAMLLGAEPMPAPEPDPTPVPVPDPTPTPDPDPTPDPGPVQTILDPYPVTVAGKLTDFRTAPPEDLLVRTHPRFLIPGREKEIAAKFSDQEWIDGTISGISTSMELQALRYAVLGDMESGLSAKQQLLGITADGMSGALKDDLPILLTYDWIFDLLDADQEEQVFELLCERTGISVPNEGEWSVLHKDHTDPAEVRQWYNNNYNTSGEAAGLGFQMRGLIALGFHGDDVRDEWCEYGVQALLDGTLDARFFPIYDAQRGGVLDLHNTIAMNSGGCKMGPTDAGPLSGYNGMCYADVIWTMLCWETATGDDLFSRDNGYRKMSQWLAYKGGISTREGVMCCRLLTGIYREIEPDNAALAAWLIDQYAGKPVDYGDIIYLCVGDRSVRLLWPQEARLQLFDYHDGMGEIISKTSWMKSATDVRMTATALDTQRHQDSTGLLMISTLGAEVIADCHEKKDRRECLIHNGVMCWNSAGPATGDSLKSTTYWGMVGAINPYGEPKNPLYVKRATYPRDAAIYAGYRGQVPQLEQDVDDGWRMFSVDSAQYAADWPNKVTLDVRKRLRTVLHLLPDDRGREFVVVQDVVEVGPNVSHCQAWRLYGKPEINERGDQFISVNGPAQVCGTVLSPGLASLVVQEGTLRPDGTPLAVEQYYNTGNWGLYVVPQVPMQQCQYLTVMEIGDTGFDPATVQMTDSGRLQVGDWTVDLNDMKVSK